MKRTDIALLGVIVIVSFSIAFFVGQSLLGKTKLTSVKVKTIDTISSDLTPQPQPDPKIFNSNSINPAVPIDIGNPQNQQPFSGDGQ